MSTTTKTDLAIANEILAQLGGQRFCVMTGAKNIFGTTDGVQMAIGAGASRGINRVRVTLTVMDTYKVEFFKVRGGKTTLLASREDVYADSLRAIFTAETGFYTSL